MGCLKSREWREVNRCGNKLLIIKSPRAFIGNGSGFHFTNSAAANGLTNESTTY